MKAVLVADRTATDKAGLEDQQIIEDLLMKADEQTVRAGEHKVSTIAMKADLSAERTATDEAGPADEKIIEVLLMKAEENRACW